MLRFLPLSALLSGCRISFLHFQCMYTCQGVWQLSNGSDSGIYSYPMTSTSLTQHLYPVLYPGLCCPTCKPKTSMAGVSLKSEGGSANISPPVNEPRRTSIIYFPGLELPFHSCCVHVMKLNKDVHQSSSNRACSALMGSIDDIKGPLMYGIHKHFGMSPHARTQHSMLFDNLLPNNLKNG